MSSNEAKKEQEEKIDITMDDFIKDLNENVFKEGRKDFEDRVQHLKEVTMDYALHPSKFTMMGDAYLAFFKLDDNQQFQWLNGGMKDKIALITEELEFEDDPVIINRVLNFVGVLRFSHNVYNKTIYNITADRLMYTLSGLEGFLTDLGYALYRQPPKLGDMPNSDHHEGMFM